MGQEMVWVIKPRKKINKYVVRRDVKVLSSVILCGEALWGVGCGVLLCGEA